MIDEKIILDSRTEEPELTDLLSRRFKALAKEYLQMDLKDKSDFGSLIKDSARFFSFKLPLAISEMFIENEFAPLYLVYKSPLTVYIDEFYKVILSQSSSLSVHNSIKDFFTKWIVTGSGNEKKYFAASTINFIEKKASKSNFYYLILQSVIHSYDQQFNDPQKAFALLENARELINNCQLDQSFKDELNYLIELYSGFFYFNLNEPEPAKEKFASALIYKPYGVTAKFYYSLSETILNGQLLSSDIINDLFEFDLQRINHAIDLNNLVMLDYFLAHPVAGSFFNHPEFSSSVNIFANFFRDMKNTRNFDLNVTRVNLTQFKDLKITEYQTPELLNNVAFLESVLQKYSTNDNILFLGASEKLQQKFSLALELVTNEIRKKYLSEMQVKLKIFDVEIQDKLVEMDVMTKDYDSNKIKLKEKLSKTIESIEKRAVENIAILEERISNLHLIQSLNPKTAFKNAMTYNFILSFTVSLMGGCAGYSNNFLGDTVKDGNVFSVIITSGMKWGIVAFLVGFLIALIAAGLALLEGANQKQHLLQTINALKNEKAQHIEHFKGEVEIKEKELEDKYARGIEQRRKYVDSIRKEKEEQEKTLREEAEKKILDDAKVLLTLSNPA